MKRISLIMMMAATVSFTACIKDNAVNLGPGASPPVVEWETATIQDPPTNAATNIYRTYGRSFGIASSVTMNLKVDYTGTDPAPADITVNLSASTAAYAAYVSKYSINTGTPAYGATGYVEANNPNPLMPTTLYTMPASVVIPKGQRSATVTITLKTDQFNLAKNYWLPLSITSVSSGTVSGNYGTVIYVVNAKNAYDADYTTTGFLFHPTAGSERAISKTQHFYSAGLNTSYKEFGDLGANGYQYQFDINGSTLSNYVPLGATPAIPASGFMTADNPGNIPYTGTIGNSARPGTAPWVQSTYNNTYDAASKTFYLHVGYQTGGNGQNTFTRQVYEKSVRAN
ncbi:DUF1735 domain-containing protein [Mucilaginibacter mali]|uniref:DUF1735 domain-containing protein n=1 Tax=Mucilaginibacter mali TaxID=2740462 RepID=A0A7D4UEY9_9SPHI|nr:DUF1735 domain-containing protein [Mucilaginibacter mali]QKJ32159.1 DUF1735 domain-containing protein [Mucilaginibacter mali]